VYQRLIEMQDDGVPDDVVGHRLDHAIADLTGTTGSRYDTTRNHVLALMRMKSAGRGGVPNALDRLLKVYLDAEVVTARRVATSSSKRSAGGAATVAVASDASDAAGVNHPFSCSATCTSWSRCSFLHSGIPLCRLAW
jgi:hypothetical protein